MVISRFSEIGEFRAAIGLFKFSLSDDFPENPPPRRRFEPLISPRKFPPETEDLGRGGNLSAGHILNLQP